MIREPYIPSLGKAKYTILLKDLDTATKSSIDTIFSQFDVNTDSPSLLKEQFYSLWNFYEINDNDTSLFLQCVQDTFNEYRDYYKEILINYQKEYDYSTGNKHTTVKDENSSGIKNSSSSVTDNNVRRDYDLPNKTIDPLSENGYLTGKTSNDTTTTETNNTGINNAVSGTTTTTYGEQFLRLKREYLNQIRNVYRDFANRFTDCFLHIY